MRTVVLEDGMLDRLALNPMVVGAFPFFSVLAGTRQGCNCGAARTSAVAARNDVKQAIIGLPVESLKTLKVHAAADKLRIFYHNGQSVQDVTI